MGLREYLTRKHENEYFSLRIDRRDPYTIAPRDKFTLKGKNKILI